MLENASVRAAYLLWYPLIAACSYISVSKKDPFAAEYIIPQLLMQWVRCEIGSQPGIEDEYSQLIGIRYFSCVSQKASETKFNYVFPTSGKQKISRFAVLFGFGKVVLLKQSSIRSRVCISL